MSAGKRESITQSEELIVGSKERVPNRLRSPSAGIREHLSMDGKETIAFYRMRLPHWEVKRGVYFLTMHVKGSLPRHVMEEASKISIESRNAPADERWNLHRRMFKIIDTALDLDRRIDYLARPKIAAICMEAIHFRHQQDIWEVVEYVLMPNHVHLLFRLKSGKLRNVMEGFKRWTSMNAVPVLQLKRSLWQREWFDHWSRSTEEDERIATYIRNNPVKAGLVNNYRDWPYASWNDPVCQRAHDST